MDRRPVIELKSAIAAPPSTLSADCSYPADLPDSALSAGATMVLWAQDRISLLSCRDRHSALREFYRDRDSRLAGP